MKHDRLQDNQYQDMRQAQEWSEPIKQCNANLVKAMRELYHKEEQIFKIQREKKHIEFLK